MTKHASERSNQAGQCRIYCKEDAGEGIAPGLAEVPPCPVVDLAQKLREDELVQLCNTLFSKHKPSLDTETHVLGKWSELDSDGVSADAELATLTDHGISAIDLDATASDETVSGNTIDAVGTVAFDDATTGTFAEVTFVLDGAPTTFTLGGIISSGTEAMVEATEPEFFVVEPVTGTPVAITETVEEDPVELAKQAKDDKALQIEWGAVNRSKSPFFAYNHEPHLNFLKVGAYCETCHKVDPGADISKAFKQFDPMIASSSFKPIKKETCAECHGRGAVAQNCLECHKYHNEPAINKSMGPMATK